ncbi:IPT/TIG domain-containing protein [Pontibacter sp. BT731]|uniref:IPT/TIG domain-containing protein n=1 Tax=Pontibacter coccineus TaxID=3063328 RepID=UPI0026E22776|nr:IPT/TIG domain-containing protein [Pontibacter sp. BT731]MDO6390783.1 IPT/TIG domain-containing protein [Pontibacter sp. BT731]
MAQLYNPPLGRLLRTLLLQCVIMLGLVSAGMAQAPTTNTTVTYGGPWFGSTQGGNVTSNRLVTDGDDLAPSTTGGSAQLRYTDSYVNVKLQDAGSTGQTGYKVSYTLKATTTRSSYNAKVRVSYLLYDGESEVNVSGELVTVTTTANRNSLYLPNNVTNVKFQLEEVSNAYVFLDAITVSQEPEIAGFTPSQGLPKEIVTVTGKHLDEATQVYFGNVVATPIDKADEMLTVAVPYGVKTDKITVVNPYGFAIGENEFVVPAPVFNATTAFSPSEAAPGQTITVYGQNFTGVNQVLFNGVAAVPTTIKYEAETEDSEITVTIPLGATSGPLTVSSPAGSTVSTSTFTVLGPQILVQEDEPNAGFEFYPATGSAGDEVTIYGKYFLAVTEVQFNGVKATNFSVVNDSTIKVTVPLGAGTGVIKVLAPAGEDESSVAFDVPAPKFADYDAESSKFQFSPNTAGPGMQIKLFGTNMSSVTTVLFAGNNGAGVEAAIAQPTRDDELTVTVPDGAETGTIRIFASGAGKEDESEQVFNFVPTPVITAVTTTTGGSVYGIVPAEGTTDTVKISGENFLTAEQVVFGSTTIGLYDAETRPNGFQINEAGTEIIFPLVTGMATGSITVKTKGGEAAWEGPLEVIYQPSVISISPTKGPLGRAITITGQYLKYVSEVTFLGSTEGAGQTVTLETPNAKDNELVVTVPAGTTTGVLRLTNPAGTTTTTQQYEVVLIPVITAFNPVEGVVGDEVTIEGYNFTGTTSVKFGALEATSFEVASDELMTAVVPDGAQTSLIEITNGVGPGTSEAEFKIIQKPTITTVSPLRGIAGEIVKITGTNFYGNLLVTFLGSEEENDETTVTVASANVNEAYTQLTVAVPVGTVTGKLMVTNAAGDSEHSTDIYEIITKPEIVSFNPTEGKVGDIVTITGWLLDQVTTVEFNGTSTTPITEGRTNRSFTVAVPMDATTGPLALLVDGTEMFNTEEDIFTVIPAPIITSVEKDGSGVAGTVVRIIGSNFTSVTKVTFLGTTATGDDTDATPFTINAEGTVITTTVPYAAITGKIQVIAPAGNGISPEDFIVPIPVITAVSRNSSYANELVTITGNYFTNMTRLTFNGMPADITGVTIEVNENGVESVTVKAPFDAGTGLIALTTPAGVSNSSAGYTVIEPVISAISVNQGYAEKTTVTITGADFMTYFNGTKVLSDGTPIVRFNGTLATIVGTPTDESITVEVPVGATSGSISVQSLSGIGYSETFNILFPSITAYTINPAYAGQTITITGDNFIDIEELTFKGVVVPIVSKVERETGGTITFVAPYIEDPGNTGTGSLIVKTKTGSSKEASNFTVIKPSITSITPIRVYAGIGAQVTIAGANFMGYYDTNEGAVRQAVPTVRFNGSTIDATVADGATESQLVVAVPQDATTGAVTIRSGSGVRTESTVEIIGAPRFRATSTFVANSGTAGTPVFTSFVIHGANFDQASKVEFLGTAASGDEVVMTTGFTVNATGTQISLSVPAGAVAGPIAVTTPYNNGGLNAEGTTVKSTSNFRVVNAPTITSIATTAGAVSTTIRINGTNLWDVMSIRNGKAKVFFKTHNPTYAIPNAEEEKQEIEVTVGNYDNVWGTWLEVTVPAKAISGAIRVENIAGSVMSAETFDVTTPMIVRFEKENNSVIEADNAARLLETVYVKGYKLTGVGTIKIGGTSVRNFYEEDEYSLEMIVPRGATTDEVTITSTGGTETSSTDLFINQPVINFVRNSQSITGMKFSTEPGKEVMQSYTLSASSLAYGEQILSVALTDGTMPYTVLLEGVETDYKKGFDLTVDENGNVTEQVVTVKFAPIESGSYNTTLNHRTNLYPTTRLLQLNGDAIIPLPVELIAFNARKEGNGVQLTWATASELDNDYFEVQMTEDLKGEFKAVGKVKSRVNTTSLRQDYQFNHKGNFNGTRYYRLKQVDLDGTTDYSKVVAVSSTGVNLAVGPRVYPNPINADSKLVYNADRAGKLNVRIVNMNGSAVQNLSYDIEEGENTILLNLNNNLPKGIYILMTEFNGKTEQVKLMKQ